jgi:hypothetical protein
VTFEESRVRRFDYSRSVVKDGRRERTTVPDFLEQWKWKQNTRK